MADRARLSRLAVLLAGLGTWLGCADVVGIDPWSPLSAGASGGAGGDGAGGGPSSSGSAGPGGGEVGGAGGAGPQSSASTGGAGGANGACGDRVIDPGEECDDGNTDTKDGCIACKIDCTSGAGWTAFLGPDNHCFGVHVDTVGWLTARSRCVGEWHGYLARIDAPNEHDFIADELGAWPSDVWIGANDSTTRGTFVWTDGAPVTSPVWGPDQPNGDAVQDEDCVFLSMQNGWTWFDALCSNLQTFVCERDTGLP